ncbi:helix-turn-helix domain-containing protein [Pedobacter alpinus]|uniref:helix-turn-helix domain-containing protein n=1 Tax=Pedobacter alpinus TaxID=1590643 RepID=UPI0036156ECB
MEGVNKGYSQECIAFILNISKSNYSKIESGSVVLTVQRLFEIAEILKVQITTLLRKTKKGEIIVLNSLMKIICILKTRFKKLFFNKRE